MGRKRKGKSIHVDSNGFSHLEWSSSVPYNLAEEPDEVRGMKHSHSCQSMPTEPTLEQLSLEHQQQKLAEVSLEQISLQEVEQQQQQQPSTTAAKVEVEIRTTSLPICTTSSSRSSTSTSSEDEVKIEVKHESQAALSKKLEEMRMQSRSTVREGILKQQQQQHHKQQQQLQHHQGRKRSKSEEVCEEKFPSEMKPRLKSVDLVKSMMSDNNRGSHDLAPKSSLTTLMDQKSRNPTNSNTDHLARKSELVPKSPSNSYANKLEPKSSSSSSIEKNSKGDIDSVQKSSFLQKSSSMSKSGVDLSFSNAESSSMSKSGVISSFSYADSLQKSSSKKKGVNNNNSVPPPPMEFRDLPRMSNDELRLAKARKIQADLEDRMLKRKSLHVDLVQDDLLHEKDEAEIKTLPRTTTTTTMEQNECFIVERTGDLLETKSLPRIINHSKSQGKEASFITVKPNQVKYHIISFKHKKLNLIQY